MATRNIPRTTRKVSRMEQRQRNKEIVAYKQQGTGLFLFRNRNNTVLNLAKPDADGRSYIPALGEFKGDSYFLQLMPQEVRLVKTLVPPDGPNANKNEEEVMNENTNSEEKLILDQPATVTQSGTVEQVVTEQPPKVKKLNEDQPNKDESKDVLLNEDPLDGVDILVD